MRQAARDLRQTADDWQDKVAIMPILYEQQMALVELLNEAATALETAHAEGRRLAELVREYQQADQFHDRQGYDECDCNPAIQEQHCEDVSAARKAVLRF